MKRCPICQSLAFDDAAKCFGCLHEFTEKDGLEEGRSMMPPPAGAPFLVESATPPAFLIRIRPEHESSGLTSWTCSVDLLPG